MDKIDQLEIYENEIELYLHEFIKKYDIQDMTKESQNRWNAALAYIYNNTFKKDNSILKTNTNLYNEYDYITCNALCDYYINMCMLYTKEVSIIGFSRLSGIDDETINKWNDKNIKTFGIYKKLIRGREESLSNMLSSNKSVVGVLGILNHHYAWNNAQTVEVRPVIAAADPALIAKQYTDNNIQVAQKPDAVELPNVD